MMTIDDNLNQALHERSSALQCCMMTGAVFSHFISKGWLISILDDTLLFKVQNTDILLKSPLLIGTK